jgi:hypothetical protein
VGFRQENRALLVVAGDRDTRAGSHVTSRPLPRLGHYQRSLASANPGDNTPQIINDRGNKSCWDRSPATPFGCYQEGNGGCYGTRFRALPMTCAVVFRGHGQAWWSRLSLSLLRL